MDYLEYPFIPSIECDAVSYPFLPAHPEVLKKTASPVPLITGLNDMEGIAVLGGKLIFIYSSNNVCVFIFDFLNKKKSKNVL